MRTLVFGDIHGGLKALVQLLERAEVTETDTLIFLGDYVDGWSESAQVIQFLIELSKTNDCIFIKGNHDAWCEQWLTYGTENHVWLHHGGLETIESYRGFSKDEKQEHLDFFEAMPMYHIDAQNRLFVHAGFTSLQGADKELQKETLYFDRTLWEMALTMDERLNNSAKSYPKRLSLYNEVYIGHTPTTNYNQDQPMNAVNVWNIDTGAAFTGSMSVIDIDTKKVFQSDIVKELYPDELGRNK